MFKHKPSWLIIAIASGLLITACEHQSLKKTDIAPVEQADKINNAIIQKSPNDDRTYAAILLPNQLQVVLISDPTLENSAASLAVGVGSSSDPETQPGLAHYLEHMLFLGTKKYPVPDNFFEFVQTNAGETNAFTAYDKTNFLFQINSEKFDEALDRYSDYFKSPLLDPQYADKERNAVNSEWSMDKSQDNWIIHTLDGVTGNPANPLARFSIGNLETLVDKKDSKLQEEVKNFYNRYYSANIMKLTLVGKQSIPELKALATKYFSDIPNKNVERPKVTVLGLTEAQMGKSIHYKPQKDSKLLLIDFPIKDNKAQWKLKPNEYVTNLIGSEEEGTLCEQLRKMGLTNNVSSEVSADEYGADGYLRIQAELTDEGLKNSDKVIAAVFSYVELVKQQGLNEKYFRELKAMREKDFTNQSKMDPLKQAISITNNQFDLPVENLVNSEYVYDHYDAQVIQNVFSQLKAENARVWYINKQESVDKAIPYFDGMYAVRDITADERQRWQAQSSKLSFKLPPENTLFTDKPADIVANTYLKPHAVVSQKGVEAFLTHPEFYREDKGYLEVEVNVDFAKKSAKNIVLSNVLNDLFKFKNTTLIDRAERASLGIVMHVSGTNSPYFSVAGYTTKHELLVNDLLKNFSELNFSESDFADTLDKYKRNLLNNKKAIPLRQGYGNVRRLVGEAHWTDAELLAEANKLTLKELLEYHKAIKANPFIRINAFGNYTEDNIKKIAQNAALILPGSRMPEARTVAHFITPKKNQKIAFKDVVEQADNAVIEGFWGDKKSDDEQAQFVVLNALFGNVFFSQLRTNEQLGYIVGSTPHAIDDIPGFVIYVQSTNTELTKVKARMDLFRKEFLEQLKNIDPATIEQFKKAEAASVLQKPTDFYKEAQRYGGDFWAAHYDFTSRDRYLASLEKVNKENLIALYKKLLVDEKGMSMLVQMKGASFKDKPFAQ